MYIIYYIENLKWQIPYGSLLVLYVPMTDDQGDQLSSERHSKWIPDEPARLGKIHSIVTDARNRARDTCWYGMVRYSRITSSLDDLWHLPVLSARALPIDQEVTERVGDVAITSCCSLASPILIILNNRST
jgi:hypothetical protein